MFLDINPVLSSTLQVNDNIPNDKYCTIRQLKLKVLL